MLFDFNFNFNSKPPKHILGEYGLVLYNKKNPIALDIGSSIGAFPLKWYSAFDKIYCIDACFKNLELLRDNLRNNQITNCYSFHFAASNNTGKLCKIYNAKSAPYNNVIDDKNMIYKEPGNAQGISDIKKTNIRDNKQFHHVFSISFDDVMSFFNLDRVDFLKVDIESSEYNFLIDADLSIVDVLALELHFLENEQSKKLFQKISQNFDMRTSKEGIHGEYLFTNKTNKNKTLYEMKCNTRYEDMKISWH